MRDRLRVLITRTRRQASALAAQLDALGAQTILIPTIELVPPSSYEALDAALDALANPSHLFDWLVFTSVNAVKAFRDRLQEKGNEVYPLRIATVGPATLKALVEAAILPRTGHVLMPESYVAESLATDLLAASSQSQHHFLLVRAEEARDIIPTALGAAGHRVTIASAYRNITPPGTIPALQALFGSPETQPDVITFTSSSTVRNLFSLMHDAGIAMPRGVVLASIGPITSATLNDFGHEPTVEAAEPTIDSLVAAITPLLTR